MNIIFDYNRTLFNPETGTLYPGVLSLLQTLAVNNTLFLISRDEPGREDRLEQFGIKKYFEKVCFVIEKDRKLFTSLIENAAKTIVIGDRVREEIRVGNELGFITILIKQGFFADELPRTESEKPTHTVKNISEILEVIKKYEN